MRFWTGVLVLVIGLVLGAALAVMGPRVAGPYLPEAIRGRVETIWARMARALTPTASWGRPGAWISPGEMTCVMPPWTYEESDGYDTVRWAAALPGSNRSVGMIGASYFGNT